MPTTSNFGWTTPADTDLVKDGAAAIRTLGNGIDTSFLDLKGGTTDQVLAKNSNTDLDFKWVAADDADAIQKSLIDAEGDLIVGDAADAVQRLAIGSNGDVLTVDTSVDGKIKWAAPTPGGWTSLASGTLNTGAGTLSLTSISGSYKNLRLIIRDAYGATDDNGLRLQVNSVTSYDFIRAGSQASGAAMGSEGLLAQSRFLLYFERNDNTNDENFFQIDFYDYADTTTYKFIDANQHYKQNNDSRSSVAWTKGISRDTAAISSITIDLVSGGNWGAAGTYVLYGGN